MQGDLTEARLQNSGPEMVTTGASSGLFDWVTFMNVPKGPFRVSLIRYERFTGKTKGSAFSPEREMVYSVYSPGRKVYPQGPGSSSSSSATRRPPVSSRR